MRLIDADELEEEIYKQYRHFSQRIAISPVFEAIKKAPSLNLSDAVIAEVMQMDDLIRRQAVLSLAKDVTLEGGAKHRCVDATEICLLPSVQQMKDTIYRQEAIDVICSMCYVEHPKSCDTRINNSNWCPEVYALQNLPSTQPEQNTEPCAMCQEFDCDGCEFRR